MTRAVTLPKNCYIAAFAQRTFLKENTPLIICTIHDYSPCDMRRFARRKRALISDFGGAPSLERSEAPST